MPAHRDSEWQQGMCPVCPKNTRPAATAQGPCCQSSGEKLGKNRPQPWAHGEAGWAQGHRWLREKSQPFPRPLPQPCAPLPSQHHCPNSPYPSPSVISAPLVPIPAPQALFRCQLCRFSSFHIFPLPSGEAAPGSHGRIFVVAPAEPHNELHHCSAPPFQQLLSQPHSDLSSSPTSFISLPAQCFHSSSTSPHC